LEIFTGIYLYRLLNEIDKLEWLINLVLILQWSEEQKARGYELVL